MGSVVLGHTIELGAVEVYDRALQLEATADQVDVLDAGSGCPAPSKSAIREHPRQHPVIRRLPESTFMILRTLAADWGWDSLPAQV